MGRFQNCYGYLCKKKKNIKKFTGTEGQHGPIYVDALKYVFCLKWHIFEMMYAELKGVFVLTF